jgi:acetyltransferase-like isoleucine patch superfamily enzyme
MDQAKDELVIDKAHSSTNEMATLPFVRIVQRYLIPNWMAAIYYSLRYHCLVSTQARVQLSDRISFGRGTVVKPFAILQTQSGRISIGQECAIGSFNHISTGKKDVRMGNYVRIGPSVTILGGSRNFERRDMLIVHQGSHHKSVIIGDDVLIGAGCVILPGSIIGNGVVIGAGSVVNSEIPAFAIVAGAPARILGERQ